MWRIVQELDGFADTIGGEVACALAPRNVSWSGTTASTERLRPCGI